ncbi:hypothetical protein SAMN02745248_01570 [Hathewaya proteolytica DSM 3090]|uniref:SbsA Ig-like domain-containing protein n=1 Tax=Hathewaya proteolytica DSM 3090 TaxID=1121331 RepID=A0A1M6NZN8_9CLOT|nr:hypothetical protein [Hathewaya proteolytica]SHK01130.1 hypothetical protein SAMN02745248_01570 [Hathewaya proteolytica DSM 3090]
MKKVTKATMIMAMIFINVFCLLCIGARNVKACEQPCIKEKGENSIQKKKIPMLVSLKQTDESTLEIKFNNPVDIRKAVTPRNYWIQSLDSNEPNGIATVGKNDNVSMENSLRRRNVRIVPKEGSNEVFEMKFNQQISKGKKYKLIICHLTSKDQKPYDGNNGVKEFTGK